MRKPADRVPDPAPGTDGAPLLPRSRRGRMARPPMRTTVTHDPDVIDVQQWARRYVALVSDLLERERLSRAG